MQVHELRSQKKLLFVLVRVDVRLITSTTTDTWFGWVFNRTPMQRSGSPVRDLDPLSRATLSLALLAYALFVPGHRS